jgi:hypothetical protein
MTKNANKPLSEQYKQNKPMDGETPPKDAFIKARIFASQEASRLKDKGAKFIK